VLTLRRRPPVYVFVIWSQARHLERRILDDLAEHFTVLDVVEVTWSTDDRFARSLTRMYGDALPPGSDKEVHCGNGPFLLVVVQDRRPRFRPRRTGRGHRLLNSRVYDARLRYREWTGGGYRVHASDSVEETERNLVLMLGVGIPEISARERSGGDVARRHARDPVGTDGWDSVDQLLRVLAPYGVRPAAGHANGDLSVLATDVWWAEHIAGGHEVGPGVREVAVAGQPRRLTVLQQPTLLVRAWNALTGWGLRP
jgi:hypothetical protein